MLELSLEPFHDRPIDSASGFPIDFPGLWWSRKSNGQGRGTIGLVFRLSCLPVMKYSRFLWSVQISHGVQHLQQVPPFL